MHEEEMSKILVYLKGFAEEERLCLAQITALWLASGQIPATTLRTLINVNFIPIGCNLDMSFLWKIYNLVEHF